MSGVLRDGVFTQKQAWKLRGNWTAFVADGDSLLLYDAVKGKIQTGTFAKGVYVKKNTYSTFTGLTKVAASCESVVLYEPVFGSNRTGTLKRGVLTFVDSFVFGTGWDLIDGSCDTLGFMHANGSIGATGTFALGEYVYHGGYTPALNAPTHFVNTRDSYLLYSSTEGKGEWGDATGGVDSGSGHANDFSPWTTIAATADSVLFYNPDGNAAVATLSGGANTFKGALALAPGWKLIAGGR